MTVVDRPEPGEPGPGQVLVHPEAVGICGSDYHLFSGHLSDAAGGSQFPRVLGHEVGATIAAVGPDCRADLRDGQRVAICRSAPAARATRAASGGRTPATTSSSSASTSTAAFRSCSCLPGAGLPHRGRRRRAGGDGRAGLGRGSRGAPRAHPGRASTWWSSAPGRSASAWRGGARARRRRAARRPPGEPARAGPRPGRRDAALDDGRGGGGGGRDWGGAGGPPVVVDATGVPAAVRAMVDMVASAGRAVQVGMANDDAPIRDREPDREGARRPGRELLHGRRLRGGGGRRGAQRRRPGAADQPRVRAGPGPRGDALCHEQSDRRDEGGDPR